MPDVIQALWIGPRLSTMERLSVSSFLRNGHAFHLYVYQPVDGVPAGTLVKNAAEILPASAIFTYRDYPTYAGFANFFRYKLLLERGGWFVDLDTICLRPFEFASELVLSSQFGNGNPVVNLAAIKVPVGSDVMRWAWEQCQAIDPREMRWGQSGPELVTRAVQKFSLSSCVTTPEAFNPVDYPDWKRVLEAGVPWGIDDRPFAIHLWNEMWRRADQDKDAPYDPRCLYEQLKRRYLSPERPAQEPHDAICVPGPAAPRSSCRPKTVNQLSITAVVLTRNGATRLPRCLESVARAGFADEILVCVDAATTDDSAEVARRFTPNVQLVQTAGYIESVLPHLASLCHGDYILRVDDDERLGGRWDRDEFLALAGLNDIAAFTVPRRWIVPPGNAFLFGHPWFPDLQLRLIRNDPDIITWPREVHAPIVIEGGSIVLFDRWLDHFNLIDTSREERERKCLEYLRLRPDHDLSRFYLWEEHGSALMSCEAAAFDSVKDRVAQPCRL